MLKCKQRWKASWIKAKSQFKTYQGVPFNKHLKNSFERFESSDFEQWYTTVTEPWFLGNDLNKNCKSRTLMHFENKWPEQ